MKEDFFPGSKVDSLTRRPWFSYAVAIAATALATFVRLELDPWLGVQLPYATYFVAIIAAGWGGGWRPAALAAALGFLLSLYLFVPPRYSLAVESSQFMAGMMLYLVAAAMIVAIIEALHAGRRRSQRQRQLWQTTVASIGDAVLTTDSAGRITFLNPVAERLTGWPLGDALGRAHEVVLRIVDERGGHPQDTPVARALRQEDMVALGEGRMLVARDGSECPIDDSAAPIRDEQGASCGVVVVFRDISARREAERAGRLAHEHVVSTLESIPDAFIRVDPDWRIDYVNRQFERRFGRQHGSQAGKILWEEWPELLGTRAEIRLRRAMSGREIQEFEDHYAPWNGWFAMRVCPTVNGDLAVFIQDITDRRQAEQALRASEERFRLAAEAVNGIIYDYDVASGTVERSNGLYDVLGYRPEEVSPLADWWWEQIHPDDRRALLAECAPGTPHAFGRGLHVYRARHRDGHYVWLSDRSLGVLDAHGRLVRQVGCSIDITALKAAEDHLKDADRRKDEFLATLAHELRNPLAPISNAVHFLKMKAPPEPAAAWGLGVIERQAHNMARLLDDLLDVSRIARNKLVLRRQPVELAAVLQQAVETSRPLIDMGGHELTVSLPPEPVELDADPMRLAQVFSNLLTNAAKYTPGGGHIRVAAARQEEQVRVSVRDDGIGIAADMLPRLFQIFSQAESALERSQGGLGIGLSLVRGLVELHGGSIEARSDGVGRGSEFIVRLPALARGAAPLAAAPMPQAEPQRSHCKIVVADDNRDGADSMALTLENIGHEVFTAYDGDDALALAELHRPDVALLDIGMPKKNGYDLCRAIRARPWGGDVVLIALTGWGQEEDRRRAQEAGFDYHLVKPVDVGALTGLLASMQLKPQ
jgi:PAS domain S-box-containing protein